MRVKRVRRDLCEGWSHVNDQARRMRKREVFIGPERCGRKRHSNSTGRQLSDYEERWDVPISGLDFRRLAEPCVGKGDHHAIWVGSSLLDDSGVTIEVQYQSGSLWACHQTEITDGNRGKESSRSSDAAVFR